jgi:hypothetical protein
MAFALVGVCAVNPAMARAQSIEDRIADLDGVVGRVKNLEQNSHFRRDNLAGVSRNLTALSDRWERVWPALAQLAAAAPIATDTTAADVALAVVFDSKAISNLTLGASRYTGFTQNETSSAWCGSNVLIGFNDTGSEIKTLVANSGVSVIGFSVSANHGTSFIYNGSPTPTSSFSQAIMGNPSVVCGDANSFYYASIWMDTLNNATGVAVARSTNGGQSFPPPTLAISKSSITHMIDRDWLAIDHVNPSNLYIAYRDIDYSGEVCGDDTFAQPIPRYAIEVVTSTNAGQSWSAPPTVIEGVCASEVHPNLSVTAPQIAVGPAGEVYVAYEAMGENDGSLADREIRIAKSIDGGAVFGAPVNVARVNPVGNGADVQGFVYAGEFPALAIGHGKSNSGFVYLTWATGAFSIPDNLSTTGLYGFADVMFAQSQDGGANWSVPLRVNNDLEGGAKPLSDQFEPAIATDKNGASGSASMIAGATRTIFSSIATAPLLLITAKRGTTPGSPRLASLHWWARTCWSHQITWVTTTRSPSIGLVGARALSTRTQVRQPEIPT